MTEMNYNPEEYKAKKRAELDKAYEMLKEETEAIVFDKGELIKYLDTQAKFNMYSVSNAILIAKQNPDAMQLIQVSEKGIWNASVGTEYSLKNDEWFPSAKDVIDSAKRAIENRGVEMGG